MKPALGLMLLALSCQFPSPADDPELLSNLRFSPGAFDSFRENTELRYTLKAPVRLSIVIVHRDSSGLESLVKVLAEDLSETRGAHAHAWLGDTMHKVFAPAGEYRGRVVISGKAFDTEVLIYH